LALRRRVHTLYRWSFNMRTGAVREGVIDDLNTEFPMVNADLLGRRTRYSFNQHLPLPEPGSIRGQCQTFDALVRYDLETGAAQRYDYGEGVFGNEAPVAPCHATWIRGEDIFSSGSA
jgi:carotenoid cleavage dioxygenase